MCNGRANPVATAGRIESDELWPVPVISYATAHLWPELASNGHYHLLCLSSNWVYYGQSCIQHFHVW